MLALLKLDQLLPVDAAHFFAEPIVREALGLPCALDPGCDQRQRGVAEEFFVLEGGGQRSEVVLRILLRVKGPLLTFRPAFVFAT